MLTNQSIKLSIETFGNEYGFIAWIDNEKFKGMVVQSNSFEGVLKELFTSLKVKFYYDYGISIGGVEEKVCALVKDYYLNKFKSHYEINLNFA